MLDLARNSWSDFNYLIILFYFINYENRISTTQNILLVCFLFSQCHVLDFNRNQHVETHKETNRQDLIYLCTDL